jgi:poly-gamma-glutamate biosynthesis protein PgsC/CapC
MTFETILVGLLCAVLFIELFGLYPGGIIVPAYMALFLGQPLRLLATVIIAFLCLLIFELLSGYLILFGKRRFVMFIFLGALLAQVWSLILPHAFAGSLELRAIGWLIPGLLANNLERQRIVPTLASLVTVSVVTYFIVRLLVWAGI